MKRVLAFGAFDPLHEGHKDFLRKAKARGDHLTVIVARDSSIRTGKGYEPEQPEEVRLAAVRAVPEVDEAQLGNKTAHHYELLGEIEFNVLALGYDQEPSDGEVQRQLKLHHKYNVEVVRLKPFQPERYKGKLLRGGLEPDGKEESKQ